MRRTVYMDKNMLTLFINTARSEIVVNKYADMEEKGKKVYLAEKNRAGFYYLAYYNDSAQKTPAVRKNVRGMNAPITNNATIIPTGFSSGILDLS